MNRGKRFQIVRRRQRRHCLKCERRFTSTSVTNRLCDKCRQTASSFTEGVEYPLHLTR